MLLSNQQSIFSKYSKEFKYLRVRQLHALVQAHCNAQESKIDERRMEIMLRQMRTGTNYVWLRGDVVSYGDRRIDPRLLEALDVMLELTKAQPGFYSKDGLHEPFSCALPETERGRIPFQRGMAGRRYSHCNRSPYEGRADHLDF